MLGFLKKYDFSFFIISTSIFIIGIFNLYSATHASADIGMAKLYKVHIIHYFLSLLVGLSISFIQPKTFYRFSYFSYGVATLSFGVGFVGRSKGNGSAEMAGHLDQFACNLRS